MEKEKAKNFINNDNYNWKMIIRINDGQSAAEKLLQIVNRFSLELNFNLNYGLTNLDSWVRLNERFMRKEIKLINRVNHNVNHNWNRFKFTPNIFW